MAEVADSKPRARRPKTTATIKLKPVPKNRGGRPKGLPKTGGRKKGTPNGKTILTAEHINRAADPLGLLCQIARGARISASKDGKRAWVYPSLDQRITAATTLARKVLPDVKAIEHSGPDGNNLVIRIVRFGSDTS